MKTLTIHDDGEDKCKYVDAESDHKVENNGEDGDHSEDAEVEDDGEDIVVQMKIVEMMFMMCLWRP